MNFLLRTAIILVMFISLVSCSSSKKKTAKDEARNEVPEWAYSPMIGCLEKTELCASGDGETMQAADANARKSLASIFETQIKSDFSILSSSSQEGTDPSAGEFLEQTYKQINEIVDQSLEGVQIKQRAQVNGIFYAQAVYDKRSTSDRIRQEIQKIDAEMQSLMELKKRSLYKKLNTLYQARADLATRYQFLSGIKLSEKITAVDLNEIKYGKSLKVLNILIESVADAKEISAEIKNNLTQIGHKIVTQNADASVKIDLKKKKEFFNVAGFVKYTITLNITSKNKNGEKIGSIVKSETASGRSMEDVERKVFNIFKNVIENQIDNLNID